VTVRHSDRTAIVTGAGSGIGLATTLRLAHAGDRVVAADVSEARLAELVSSDDSLDLVCVSGDITDESVVTEIIRMAGPRIDVLVNSAGVMDGFVPAAEVDDFAWDRVFAVNVMAVLRMTRAVVPAMIEAGRGAIVNVASEAAFRASVGGAAYTASKHAVAGLTKSTAVVYRQFGIRANAVAPGPVRTNLETPVLSELGHRAITSLRVPGRRRAEAEEIAEAIVWLASEMSSNVNGVVLPVDDGWSAI
jgi:NAD(P)-dependent dehydrogenase (short-subunit alcohol dehydrogenase family)